MYDRRAANMKVLNEAEETQQKTKEAVMRIQQQASATEDLGAATLEELRAQGRQMDDINNDITEVNAKLDTASSLQDKFDVWSGSLFGFGKRKANKEAAAQIASKQLEEMHNVKEVFENEKYDMFSRTWKSSSMTLCSNPATKAPQLFDPSNQASMQGSKWSIDFSLAGIDIEGWTYASDMAYLNKHGAGSPTSGWNTKARRRKWKYTDTKAGGNEVVASVRGRNKERTAQRTGGSGPANTEKIGYVPRSNLSTMKATGLSSSGGRRGKEELDEESKAGLQRLQANDREIDQGVNAISNTLDNLAGIAGHMKEETQDQNRKLEQIEGNIQKASEKQAFINERQKGYLN